MIIIQTLRLNLRDPLSSWWFLEIFNFWGYKQDIFAWCWIAYYCPSKHLCSADDKTLLKIVCKEGKFGITTPAKSGNILEQWKPMQWTPLQFEYPLFIYFRADTLEFLDSKFYSDLKDLNFSQQTSMARRSSLSFTKQILK